MKYRQSRELRKTRRCQIVIVTDPDDIGVRVIGIDDWVRVGAVPIVRDPNCSLLVGDA